jgi:hypothetical protein
MRLAYIQLGAGFPSLDEQVRQLMPLRPDDYAIEETPTIAALRRIRLRLESLAAGDRLCVTTLDAFGGSLREMLSVFTDLFRRGVVVESFDENGQLFELRPSPQELRLLDWLNGRPEAGRPDFQRRGGAVVALAGADIAEIRRLAASGVSARRIGLIFRRSPRAIQEILRARTDAPEQQQAPDVEAAHAC